MSPVRSVTCKAHKLQQFHLINLNNYAIISATTALKTMDIHYTTLLNLFGHFAGEQCFCTGKLPSTAPQAAVNVTQDADVARFLGAAPVLHASA